MIFTSCTNAIVGPLRGLGGFPLRCGGTNVVITIACDNIPMVNCIGTSS